MQTVKFRLTDDDKQYIKDHIDDTSVSIAEWIGCSVNCVIRYKRLFGKKPTEYRRWSRQEIRRLQYWWNADMGIRRIAKMLDRKSTQVFAQVIALRKKGYNFKPRRNE